MPRGEPLRLVHVSGACPRARPRPRPRGRSASRLSPRGASPPEGLRARPARASPPGCRVAHLSDRLAAHLLTIGLQRGDRLAVLLPDGPGVHIAYLACEKAGLIVVGIGPRAGQDEFIHLMERSGASALLAPAHHRDLDMQELCEQLAERRHPLRKWMAINHGLGAEDPFWEFIWKKSQNLSFLIFVFSARIHLEDHLDTQQGSDLLINR